MGTMAHCGLATQPVLKRKAVLTPTITQQDTVPSERSQEKDRYHKIHLDEIPTMAKFMETRWRERESQGPGRVESPGLTETELPFC